MAFMRPMSRLRVTISRDTVEDTTTAPKRKTKMSMAQMNVVRNVPRAADKPLPRVKDETSKSALPNRKMNVVDAITLVRESRTNEVLKGLLFRSFDAKASCSDIRAQHSVSHCESTGPFATDNPLVMSHHNDGLLLLIEFVK